MTKKCIGCGAFFQTIDINKAGFVDEKDIDAAIVCRRCFRIKNYGDYQHVSKDYDDYENIFNEVINKDSLKLFLCDIFSLDETLNKINELKGKVILVITKSDLLPKSVKEYKLHNYIKNNYKLNIIDIVFVSSVKNYNLDILYSKINKYKTSNEVYLIGNTNSGKSTLINRMIKSYSNNESSITTSVLPATTLDLISVKLDDNLTLIDTPGLVNKDNYLTDLDAKLVKKLTPRTEIKPRTFQMKPNQSIIIGDYARIDYLSDHENSFTIYISNDVLVKRISLNTNDYLRNLHKKNFTLTNNKDVVISGLCFCKIVKEAKVNIYTKESVKVFERNNLI